MLRPSVSPPEVVRHAGVSSSAASVLRWLLIAFASWTCGGSTTSDPPPPPPPPPTPTTGALSVVVSGLPGGVPAQGSISGPGFNAPLTTSQLYSGLTPGLYVVAPSSVVNAGTTFTAIAQNGSVTAGQTANVGVTYSAVANPVLTVVGGGNGTGSGHVTSSPGGIDCTITSGVASGTCSAAFPNNSTVQLVPQGILVSWGTDCSGAGTCQVTMSQNRQVVVTFGAPPIIVLNTTKPVIVASRTALDLQYDYSIQNGGAGTLAPAVSLPNPPSWLQLSVVGNNILRVKIDSRGLLPYSEAKTPDTATAVISTPGGASVPVKVTYAKTFDAPAGMAATLIRFHRYTGEPTETAVPPNVAAQVDLLDARSSNRITAKILEVNPSDQNWLVPPTINSSGQLDLRPKPFSGLPNPFGNLPTGTDLIGTPVRIRLGAADGSTACPAFTIPPDPSCQVFVYYDADAFPRLVLRPWGVQLTPDKPSADVVWEKQSDSPDPLSAATFLTHDCGNRLASPPAVAGSHISIVGNFAPLNDDETFRCTVKIGASYIDTGNIPALFKTDTARLLVTLAKPSQDLITPSKLDLNIVATAGGSAPNTETIDLNNLGPNAFAVGAPSLSGVAVGGFPACPAALLATPTVSGSSIGRGAIATISVRINPQGQPAQTCTANLGMNAVGLAPRFILVTVRLK